MKTVAKNKSKSFCSECSRNLNRKVRDWFEATEEYKDILNKMRPNKNKVSKNDITGCYNLKFAELNKEEEDLLMTLFKED